MALRKTSYIIWAILISCSIGRAQVQKCPLSSEGKFGSYTASLWNLDATGADLVNTESLLTELRPTVSVGIIESGVDLGALPSDRIGKIIHTNLVTSDSLIGEDRAHGTDVASVIFNPRVGLGAPGYLAAVTDRTVEFLEGWKPEDETEFYRDHYQGTPFRIRADFKEAIELQKKAGSRVINLSGVLGSWKKTEELFRETDAILVTSAGNDPYDPQYPTESLKFRVPAIVVGTLNRYGERGGSYGTAIDILAPNQTPALNSTDGTNEESISFGMTSGATAFVTSNVVAILAILPQADLDVIERLLTITGTTTQSNRKLINSYRLVRVSYRLKKKLGEQAHSNAAVKRFLNSEASWLLDFSDEARAAIEEAHALKFKKDCQSVQRRGRLIRKAFLLTDSEVYGEMLSEFFRSHIKDSTVDTEYIADLAQLYSTLGQAQLRFTSGF